MTVEGKSAPDAAARSERSWEFDTGRKVHCMLGRWR